MTNEEKFELGVKEWKKLLDSGKRTEANQFYWENLFEINRKIFLSKVGNLDKKYQTLISIVGFSPEPLILMISALNPENVYFIVSKETVEQLDVIISKTNLRPSTYKWHEVDSSNIEQVYAQIRSFADLAKEGNVAVDITGGKKSMVGGAAQAAAFFGFDVYYIDFSNAYHPDLRKPMPGTEFLNRLRNPFEIFGDLELKRAMELYNSGNYSAALEVVGRLISKTANVKEAEIKKEIFSMYRNWHDYNFNSAIEYGKKAIKKIDRFLILYDLKDKIEKQLTILQKLVQNDQKWIVLNHYYMSRYYMEQNNYNFAILFLYRTLEQLLAYRLIDVYSLDVSNPDYNSFPDFIDKFNDNLREIYGEKATFYNQLPKKLGLLSAANILKILDDELTKEMDLKQISEQTKYRNSGILAHGTQPNTKKQYQSMDMVFGIIIKQFVKIYFSGRNLENILKMFHRIKIK